MRPILVWTLTLTLLALPACGGSDTPTGPDPFRPLFSRSGTGNDAFNMPLDVERIRVTGTFSGSSSNFIIWVGDELIVNELLGTTWGAVSYQGTHAVPGGLTRIENSTGVVWSLVEVR